VTRLLLAGLVLLGLTGCVGPAPTTGEYEGKAAHTARAALSQLETARLAAQNSGRMSAGYLETVLVDAEEAFGSIQTTFDSIQPPDQPAADRLRAELDPLLSDGADGIAQLRILARRGDTAGMASQARELGVTADRLDRFGEKHAG
jgi:hypothetical protein